MLEVAEMRRHILLLAICVVLTSGPLAAQQAEKSGYGRLEHIESIFQPYLNSANCATISADFRALGGAGRHA